ncbi:MAG: divergent polysaccharide deacetylase family protein [Pseudomonadota bacterium]
MAESGKSARSITIPQGNIADLENGAEASNPGLISGAKGALFGVLFSLVAAIVLSLSIPLPENLPGVGAVRVIDNSNDSRGVASDQTQASTDTGDTAAPEEDEGLTVPVIVGTTAPSDPSEPESVETTQSPETTNGSGESTQTAETQADAGAGDQAAQTEPAQEPAAQGDVDTAAADQAVTADPATEAASDDTATQDAAPENAATAETETTEVAALAPTEIGPPPEPVTINLSGPALAVNARAFDVPDDAPLMAVVLANATSSAIDPEALPLLTMPLTFSVTPTSPSDRAFALAAREAQHEVLSQLPLQADETGAAGQILTSMDPERVALEVNARMAVLDMAVGATVPGDTLGASDPGLLGTTLKTIESHGFAYVDARPGAATIAEPIRDRGDVAYVAVNRLIPAGATTEQIYEILETTAYRAQREGNAILVVDASQEALQALLRWGLERDRRPVWFAPISAVIERRSGAN